MPSDADDFLDDDDGADVEDDHSIASSTTTISTGISCRVKHSSNKDFFYRKLNMYIALNTSFLGKKSSKSK